MKTWWKGGTPWIWLTGGAVTISMIMVFGLLLLILVRGFGSFWPHAVLEAEYQDPRTGEIETVIGELRRSETLTGQAMRDAGVDIPLEQVLVTRHLIKQGNRDVTGKDFGYFVDDFMTPWQYPREMAVLERREWGDFYGRPLRLLEEGRVVAEGDALWPEFQARLSRSNALFDEIRSIERGAIGRINFALERVRLDQRRAELREQLTAEVREELIQRRQSLDAEYAILERQLNQLYADAARDSLVLQVADGREVTIRLADIVKAWQPNNMSIPSKVGFYVNDFFGFIFGYPREANTEGGIFPAIFGTVVMVLVMSIIVTPFGVLAAIYLREYAKQGALLKTIRISVYNLAGVPSIVFGVFGLGFFVYFVGGQVDQAFYPEALPAPTFGTPGLFWASLTLALLTLPVVIVSTEEGLARIPSTIRQGSLALGATKSETLWKVVVPLATPAMMTGLILAIARAAGEVAPLMLVGVVKLAPTLPIDGNFPFVHLERKIMHLGFHIYDVGFQSPHAEAAEQLVYATALILVLLIVVLNLSAITIRNHLREKYRAESD
ncbi:phosphate transport system permease protein [Ectothiorhodosinus mongolicus]|uniref:Phosphate transport system permease protein PstA n=1 Tax=Ectothiorhodosinus mongolicus TaxID=233100 RepID=A0A1R3VVW6_9GAMM|nr:phosphate ABC transporter permease PstA [Ectothiorhodosinus mongolicus]ULX56966.1 phosphate ABC transporter, permease protein PstA [Ectothiorhodosinus mongolicus]SIT69215.1 phosphate transport system permease protein [Ectothiorhodosinus mongolicus]